jgi:hypothetical protein
MKNVQLQRDLPYTEENYERVELAGRRTFRMFNAYSCPATEMHEVPGHIAFVLRL